MENTEPDKRGLTLVPGNQVMESGVMGAKLESLTQDTVFKQDGNVQEGCRVVQTDRYNGMLTSRQLYSLSNLSSMETSAKELLSSISASPVTLSGLFCTGVEANVKDISTSIRSNSPVLSGLYFSEGVVKDHSTFAVSNKAAAGPDILNSHVNETKMPGLNSSSSQVQRSWLSQKPPNHQSRSVDKETSSQASVRVARPPGEGRGKNQLLPRYWPRITDQELQLLTTKDSNCTITPLFEKVLSASDAGKIGRLVLPKACAEKYFPPISQAEGVPITVQDISGKDWTFQFRFWPNNNSRMYVLEGITPCIQSMQLQAGDTVIFSRRDPEGKLVMGYRRAPNLSSLEESQKTTVGATSMAPSCQILSRNLDKSSTIASITGLLSQSIKSSSKAQVQKNSGQIGNHHVVEPGFGVLPKAGMAGSKKPREGSPSSGTIVNEKRKAKELSSKSKKPRCESDSLEFKMNWEEAQSLLRSPPNVIPSIVTIEGYDFEEYEDPPVFGKEIIPASSPRKSFNAEQSEQKKSSDLLLQHIKAAKKQVVIEPLKESEPLSGLETLAFLAVAEETMNVASSSSAPATTNSAPPLPSPAINIPVLPCSPVVINTASSSSPAATTTKHPRHRPGCSCIVCIQPPSGKGPKHKPNCDCNVCMTVKRRFHTLMLRRKKLQSEREAESSCYKSSNAVKESMECVGGKRPNEPNSHKNGSWQGGNAVPSSKVMPRVIEGYPNGNGRPFGAPSAGSYTPGIVKYEHDLPVTSRGPQIDLNSHPEREEFTLGLSMKSLLQSARYPLDIYLKEQGLTSLVCNDEQLQSSLENGFGNTILKKDDELEEKRQVIEDSDSGLEHTLVKNQLKP